MESGPSVWGEGEELGSVKGMRPDRNWHVPRRRLDLSEGPSEFLETEEG